MGRPREGLALFLTGTRLDKPTNVARRGRETDAALDSSADRVGASGSPRGVDR